MTASFARQPAQLMGVIDLADGRCVAVRPPLPQDLDLLTGFFRALSEQARYFRFMTNYRELSEGLARRFVEIDHLCHVALVAYVTNAGSRRMVGEARYILGTDDAGSAEFAVAVADGWQGLGLARALLARLSGHAAAAGVRHLVADTLASNAAMLELARAAGFTVSGNGADRRLLRLVKELSPKAERRSVQSFAVPAQVELHCPQGG